jgi:HK97 family phage prohead protease
MASNRPSLDEILEKRSGSIVSTDRGDAVVKTFKQPVSWNAEQRSARFVMSGQATDRMGDIVRTNGIDTADFEKNPVMLLFHSSRSWPVGQWSDLAKVAGSKPRLEGTARFLEEGLLEEADKAAKLVGAGVLRACSIGFMPKDWEWILDKDGRNTWGIDFKESELIECSIVPVPAHPAALVKHAGGDMALCKDFLEEVLDEWAKTPDGLIVPRSEYAKEYFAIQAKEGPVTMTVGGKTFEAVITEQPEEEAPVDLDVQRTAQDAVERELETITLGIKVDAASVERAGEEATQSVLDIIMKNLSSLFKAEPVQKTEPVIDEPDPEPEPVLASPEKIAEMKARIADVRAKLPGATT